MKKLFVLLLAGVVLVGPAQAQEEMSVGISLDALSGYIWRGSVLGADDKAVLQPGIELGFGESGLTVGAWGSFFVQDRTPLDQADEIDLYVDYSTTLSEESGIGISIGFTEYYFPSLNAGTKHTEEAYVGLSLDHQISPSLTFYYDFGTIDAWYLVFAAGVDVPLGEDEDGPALSLGGSVAMSDYGNKTGFNDATATASVSFGAGQISIAPTIGFSYADDKANVDNSSFWGGISISFSPGE